MVAANLDGETIRSAIVALPPEQREVIELGFFTGASHAEIARVTNTPLGTVKTRIRSGLSTLRRVFETEKICETSRAPDGRRQVSVRNPSAEPTGAPRS